MVLTGVKGKHTCTVSCTVSGRLQLLVGHRVLTVSLLR